MWKLMTLACAALLAVGAARAQDYSGSAFASAATSAGMAAAALGRMADGKSSNVKIQSLGRDIARDHEAANEELARLADEKGFGLPDSASASADQREDEFGSLQPEEFDRRFLEATISDHAAAIALFEREASLGADADMRGFAQRMLPVLRSHLAAAQALQKQ